MVIDCHLHMAVYESSTPAYRAFIESYWPDYFQGFGAFYGDPANVDAMLEEAGVDHAVLLADHSPLTTGVASNEYAADFCRRSKRLVPFASLNPYSMPNLAEMVDYVVKTLGCRGIKLGPGYHQYAPNDPLVYPLYARAQEHGIPITFHTGSSIYTGARMKYTDPLLLDDLAIDFPRLRVIMAHAGRPFWFEEATFLATHHPNFYLELSGLPPKNLLTYLPDLDRLASKTVFGSDWPGLPTTIKENVEAFCALPISDRAKRAILEENARSLLNL